MIVKIFCALLLVSFVSAEIPSYIHVCGRRNPNLNECIKNSILSIKDKLEVGIPELDVPSINPLNVKSVKLVDLPNFKANAKNVKIYGLHKFTIDDFHFDLENQKIDSLMTFEKLRIEADYDVNARIVIPVIGHGPIELHTDNVKTKVGLRFKTIKRNGKNYVYFYTMTVKIDVADFKATFRQEGETDDGDKTLSTAINTALVDSKKEILDNTIPHIERAISENILDLSNKIGQHFTYEELFPDRE